MHEGEKKFMETKMWVSNIFQSGCNKGKIHQLPFKLNWNHRIRSTTNRNKNAYSKCKLGSHCTLLSLPLLTNIPAKLHNAHTCTSSCVKVSYIDWPKHQTPYEYWSTKYTTNKQSTNQPMLSIIVKGKNN